MSESKIYRCSECAHWEQIPNMVTQPNPNAQPEPAGRCMFTRPTMYMVSRQEQPGAVVARGAAPRLTMEQQQFFPLMSASHRCADHSERVRDEARQLAVFVEQVRRNTLDYKPGEHADEKAAGFSRPPSLAEVRRMIASGQIEQATPELGNVPTPDTANDPQPVRKPWTVRRVFRFIGRKIRGLK